MGMVKKIVKWAGITIGSAISGSLIGKAVSANSEQKTREKAKEAALRKNNGGKK